VTAPTGGPDARTPAREAVQADDFYARLPRFDRFAAIADPGTYVPLPPDWWIGLTDVAGSTAAIADGRYKAVNFAGASIIAALTHALRDRIFPFVFGGDGASFAVPGRDEPIARATLAATSAWVRDDLGLALRGALVPLVDIRAAGLDVRVARFAASPDVAYAMFAGGGLGWAERAMKEGRYGVATASPGTRPDLTGLSCRWDAMASRHGVVLSVIVEPVAQDDPRFGELLRQVLDLVAQADARVRPVPDEAPGVSWPPPGLDLEAWASRSGGTPFALARLRVLAETLVAWLVMRAGRKVGTFDPAAYRAGVVANSDFRKYDDHLRLTIDCAPELADRVEQVLAGADRAGVARYGVHRQDAAIMTCFVPRVDGHDHVHFVDGASGGYALAAQALKEGTRRAATGAR